MPSRDPATGKRLSGAAQRARAAASAAGANPDTVVPVLHIDQQTKPRFERKPRGTSTALVKRTADAADIHALNVPAPPVGDVAAVEVWSVQVRAMLAMSVPKADEDTTASINAACRALAALARIGKMMRQTGAADMVLLRERLLGQTLDLETETPPSDIAELVVWAYHRVARIAWQATRTADPADAYRQVAVATVLAEIATTPCNDYFAAAAAKLKAAAE